MSTKARRLEAISAAVALVTARRTGDAVPTTATDDDLTDSDLIEGLLLVAHLLDQHGASGLEVLRLLGEVTAWVSVGGTDD